MSRTLQRTLLPDNCVLVLEKMDDGRFDIAIIHVQDNVGHCIDDYAYEPENWKKYGRNLDELIAKLREHDNWEDIGVAFVEWVDKNKPPPKITWKEL